MRLSLKTLQSQNKDAAFLKLQSIGQTKILSHWNQLSSAQKDHLIRQISQLDTGLFEIQQAHLFAMDKSTDQILEPFTNYFFESDPEDYRFGIELTREGKTALVILAGGQGSRLRYEGPKGCYKVSPIKNKSLYQILAEKVKAASKQTHKSLEVAIMTSSLNYVETQTFFIENAFFGLNPNQVTFFYQHMWPLLNFEGDLFLEEVDRIAQGPNGNGAMFRALSERGILQKWHNMGIEMIQVLPVDNPLALPFDYELFGFHQRQRNTISTRASLRQNAQENVGVLAYTNGKSAVIEYMDLPFEEKYASDQNGRLKFFIANLGLFCFSLSLVEKMCSKQLPIHKAKKAVRMLLQDGSQLIPEIPNAWKFEQFIFDIFPFADKVAALLSPREECFAPLKNFQGEDSIHSVRRALLALNHQVFAKITDREVAKEAVFELAPQFFYPTEELLKKWRGRTLPEKDYIDD